MSLSKLGLDEVQQDPNFTCQDMPHVDVIKEALLAAAINGCPTQRENARKLLAQMYGIEL
jgi:hypothetical protein